MHSILRFSIMLVLLLSMFAVGNSPVEAESTTAERGTDEVIVVYDATEELDCTVEVTTNSIHTDVNDCDSGAVIVADLVSRDDASQIEDGLILEPTGNSLTDSALAREAAQVVHDRNSEDPVTSMQCAAANRFVDGSYSVGNNDRVYYQLIYTVNSDCTVTYVTDRARSDHPDAFWQRSCSDGTSGNCYARNISLTPAWTGYFQVMNSYVGWQYTNQASTGLFPTYYGYWYFD